MVLLLPLKWTISILCPPLEKLQRVLKTVISLLFTTGIYTLWAILRTPCWWQHFWNSWLPEQFWSLWGEAISFEEEVLWRTFVARAVTQLQSAVPLADAKFLCHDSTQQHSFMFRVSHLSQLVYMQICVRTLFICIPALSCRHLLYIQQQLCLSCYGAKINTIPSFGHVLVHEKRLSPQPGPPPPHSPLLSSLPLPWGQEY